MTGAVAAATANADNAKPPPTPTAATALAELKASLRELLASTLRGTFGFALDKVEELAGGLDRIAADGGITINALLGGAQAHLEGRSRFWGAATRAVSALSPGAKAALMLALALALVLLPVTVLLVLLALIVCAVLISLRSNARPTGS